MEENENPKEGSMRPWIIYLVIFAAIFALVLSGNKGDKNATDITYQDFINMVTNQATLNGNDK